MVKIWAGGSASGPEIPHQRQSADVQVGLAAKADSVGLMVWIAAGHTTDGPSVRSYHVDERGEVHHTTLASDGAPSCGPVDEATDECERGGFGWTGGQFYKTAEGR